jgi:hypothetical protein
MDQLSDLTPPGPALARAGNQLVSALPEQNRVALAARRRPRPNDVGEMLRQQQQYPYR